MTFALFSRMSTSVSRNRATRPSQAIFLLVLRLRYRPVRTIRTQGRSMHTVNNHRCKITAEEIF